MANTLHGPYAKTTWTNGSTPISQSNLNNLEGQSGVALHSFNPHMIGAGFVLSGAVCTKDGVNANQLDIASGEAYLIQSDGTPTLCDIAADNTHTTTGNPSTTMYLDLNPDGSWSWGTSHSAVTNHLTICSVTTDASANIATVVDTRPTAVSLLATMVGLLTLPGLSKLTSDNGRFTSDGNGQVTIQGATGDYNALDIKSPSNTTQAIIGSGDSGYVNGSGFFVFTGGGPDGYVFRNWDGSGGNISGAIKSLGQQASVGNFGVPVIVAQAINTHVTTTGVHTILTYSIPATGLYRFSSTVYNGTSASQKPSILATYTGGNSAAGSGSNMTGPLGQPFDGVTSSLLNGTDYPLLPQIIYLKAGTNFVFQYTSGAATPNDNISVILERLS